MLTIFWLIHWKGKTDESSLHDKLGVSIMENVFTDPYEREKLGRNKRNKTKGEFVRVTHVHKITFKGTRKIPTSTPYLLFNICLTLLHLRINDEPLTWFLLKCLMTLLQFILFFRKRTVSGERITPDQ